MINGFETNVDVVTPARRENAVMTQPQPLLGITRATDRPNQVV